MADQPYEKLGAFYLGREWDAESRETTSTPLLLDSRDLTTHAVCVGMTGSGKTGLCISLLEEAAIDGVPAIVIDPKGDLANLLLTFPNLLAADFEPWVEADAARRKNLTVPQYAQAQSELWRNGLAKWDQDGDRIRRLREAAEFRIYTPGSTAGTPVSILESLAPPPPEARADAELLNERITTVSTGVLGLIGVDGDPLQSREHVLIANILSTMWSEGRTVDLPSLIGAIQSPPFERVGVMEVNSFFPEKDRMALAMRLNALLAAPGFQQWLTGVPLDVGKLLHTETGKPRIAIFSIAHLDDSQRMFFVSLLLNQVLAWMRTRPGTSSLRALLYMDEIFGFLPPSAEPPSKRPFLTLMKQARAYGLGVVLATQNPVDLDYKALSNAGTWFLGRLQTERDKMRVLDGLEGAALGGRFDRAALEQTLAGLGKRVFLFHSVHEPQPVLFHTRWAMSYLRGPLTRDQIRRLEGAAPKAETAAAAAAAAPAAGVPAVEIPASRGAGVGAPTRPIVTSTIPQLFLPIDRAAAQDETGVLYRPCLVGVANVRFVDKKTKRLLQSDDLLLIAPFGKRSTRIDWTAAEPLDLVPEDLETEPQPQASWAALPDAAESSRSYTSWRKQLSDSLYREHHLTLLHSPMFDMTSKPGEHERDFRIRMAEGAREERDDQSEALRARYAKRFDRITERIRRAEQKIDKERQQASGKKMQAAISFGATILSAFMGRGKMGTVGRATTTARGLGSAAKERQDVRRAQEDLEALERQKQELEDELTRELDAIEDRLDPLTEKLESTEVRPRRADVDVRMVALGWLPNLIHADGSVTALWAKE